MKKLSVIVFTVYSLFLVLFITFGTSAISPVYSFLYNCITKKEYKITNVEFNLNEEYLIEKEYYLDYVVYPNKNVDYELKFESLTKDICDISSDGYIYGKRTDNDKTVGKIKVTSKKDSHFEKIISVNFTKKYPTDIDIRLDEFYKQENEIYITYVNLPIHLRYTLIYNEDITEDIPYIEYDENIFENDSFLTLTPVTKTDETTIYLKLNNITKEIKLKVIDIKEDLEMVEKNSSFNKLSLYQKDNYNNENSIYYVGYDIDFDIFNDDFAIIFPYEVTSSDEEILEVFDKKLRPKRKGTVDITITLENGFSKTYTLYIKNKLTLPTLEGVEIDNKTITVLIGETSLINFVFPDEIIYREMEIEFDKGKIRLTKISDTQYKLEGLIESTSKIKIKIDDNDQSLEQEYTILVKENKKVTHVIKTNLSMIVPKILGHLAMFFVEGILAMWVAMNYHSKKKLINIIIFASIGLVLAGGTEFVQLFISGRSSRFIDVIIDFTGYVIGFLILWGVYLITKKIKKHHQKN